MNDDIDGPDPVHASGRLVLRLTEAWRWWSRPWRTPSHLVALVVAFAAPPLMVSSASMFAESAGDRVVEELAAERPERLDVTVTAAGRLASDVIDPLDAALAARISRIATTGEPMPTWFTEPIGLVLPPPAPGEPAPVIPGSGVRLLIRDGAVPALDVVDGTGEGGLLVSGGYATEFGLDVGDDVLLEGASVPVAVSGIFRDLWELDGRDPYWDDAPSVLVPRFSRVFGAPLFEVAVLDAVTASGLGLDGTVRWDFGVTRPPRTERALDRLANGIRGVERDLTESDALAEPIARFSGVGGPVPAVTTDIFELRADARSLSRELDQPIATTAVAGALLGVAIAGAGAGFVARRRRVEFALLWSDGEPRRRFVLRSVLEYLVPAAIGAVSGVAVAWAVVRWLGPSTSARLGAVDLGPVLVSAAAGLVAAATVTGAIAGRAPGRAAPRGGGRWLLLGIGIAAASWIQVGAPRSNDRVDLLVVLFPIVGTVVGVGVVVALMRVVLGRFSGSGRQLPATVFLAWRRVVAATPGASAMAVVIGSAMGLVVFPQALIDSLGDAARAKAITVVGGESRLQLADRGVDPVPGSTLVYVETTRSTIGAQRVTVLAIDTATYASAVSWDDQFGAAPDHVVDALATPVDTGLAAVLVGDGELSTTAGFGSQEVFEYTVIDTLESAPLASSVAPTLIVDAAAMEAIGRTRHEQRRPSDVSPAQWAEEYVSPLFGYRREVVSPMRIDELMMRFDEAGVNVRVPRSLDAEIDTLDARAPRWAFEYFRLLSAIAAVMAAGGLLLYLGERRDARELADAMAVRMGFRSTGLVLSTVLEVVALVMIAFASGVLTAFLVARRVFDRFEPDPTVRPDTTLRADWSSAVLLVASGLVVTVAVVVTAQVVGRRRSLAEVLGGS